MIIPISNNTITHFLKFLQIIYNFASQEGISIMEQWLVNDNCSASGFDSPYNTGNRGLAEVIGIGFMVRRYTPTVQDFSPVGL